jgi:peptide/nickel transport system permease protein
MTFAGKIALGFIIAVIALGLGAEMFSTHSPVAPSGKALEAPSPLHWLGTDDLGVDLWAQICYGARISVLVGLGTALLAGLGGTVIGILSGYYGGRLDRVIMRIVDFSVALPDLPVMVLLGAFLGPSLYNIILALAVFSWSVPARTVRAQILAIKQEKYISVARSYGAGFYHLALRHFGPGVFPLAAVGMIRITGRAIVAEASLSFLGLGDPTSRSWGLILNHALNFKGIYFTEYWKWWITAPLIAITILVAAIAILARDGERLANTKV